MRFLRPLLLILIVLSTAACTTSVRHTKDYKSMITKDRDLLILTPEVEVYETSVSGQKRLYNYEYNMESVISDQLITSFQDLGFRVKLLHRRDIHDQNLQDSVAQLHHMYKDSINVLYAKPEWEESKAFNITSDAGPSAALIGEKNNSNLLVITDYARAIKDGGSRAMNVAMDMLLGTSSAADADKAVMILGFIDTKTGKILWTNRTIGLKGVFSSSSDKKEEAAQMKKMLSVLLKPFNK